MLQKVSVLITYDGVWDIITICHEMLVQHIFTILHEMIIHGQCKLWQLYEFAAPTFNLCNF